MGLCADDLLGSKDGEYVILYNARTFLFRTQLMEDKQKSFAGQLKIYRTLHS